jgi:dGTPase
MPGEWAAAAARIGGEPNAETRGARLVCDYIAGMTDRYALAEHRRLFGGAPPLTL